MAAASGSVERFGGQDHSGRAVADGVSTLELDASEGHFTSEVVARMHHVSPTQHAFRARLME